MLITVVIKWVIHQIFVCLENFISTEDTSDMSKYKREMTLNFSFYTTNQVWWQDRGFRHIRARQLYFLSNLSWENTSGYCLVKWVWKSRKEGPTGSSKHLIQARKAVKASPRLRARHRIQERIWEASMKQTLNNTEDILMVHYYLFIRKKGKSETPGKLEKYFQVLVIILAFESRHKVF